MSEATAPDTVSTSIPGIHTQLKASRGMFLAAGILLVVAGAFAIIAPLGAWLAITILVGIALLVGGVLQAAHAFTVKTFGSAALRLVLAVLYVIVGIWLLASPGMGASMLGLVVGVLLMIEGVGRVIQGVQHKPAAGWGWCIFGGVIAAILGLLIWINPFNAAWIPGVLVGVNFLFLGVSFIAIGTAVRGAGDAPALV